MGEKNFCVPCYKIWQGLEMEKDDEKIFLKSRETH